MKSPIAAIVLLFVLAVALPARADLIDGVKWSQLPDMGPYGYDFSSETVIPSKVADDFLCTDNWPVVDLHWWGSYYQRPPDFSPYQNSDNLVDPTLATGAPPETLIQFIVEFYSDVPAGVDPDMPWSHPGELLYQQYISIADVTEAPYGTVTHIGGIQENVWQYNCELPVPFYQDPGRDPQDIDGDGIADGTVYWLMIQTFHIDTVIQWGWHQADGLWRDNAVQYWGPHEPVPPYWDIVADTDMAFELTFVPEPSLLFVLGFGAFLALKRRK